MYKHNSYIIENLSFRIDYGEVLAITGCNGTGKTTLIRCLCGLMKEKKGKIYLEIGYKQGDGVVDLLKQFFPQKRIRGLKDQFGKDRMVAMDNG